MLSNYIFNWNMDYYIISCLPPPWLAPPCLCICPDKTRLIRNILLVFTCNLDYKYSWMQLHHFLFVLQPLSFFAKSIFTTRRRQISHTGPFSQTNHANTVFLSVGEKCPSLLMGKAVGNSDVWFRFNEGMSNAVRRNVYIRELLWRANPALRRHCT